MKLKSKFWFKAKRYGWGWYPSSWQGYLALAIYIVLIAALISNIERISSTSEAIYKIIIPIVVLTSILIAICYFKGEKPGLRWG